MNCKEVQNYLESESQIETQHLSQNVLNHMEKCDDCRVFHQAEMALRSFVSDRKAIQLDDQFTEQFLQGIQKQASVKPKSLFLLNRAVNYRVAAGITAFLISAFLGIYAGKFSANVYAEQQYSTYDELTNSLNYGMTDDSFQMINFEEE